MLWKCNLNPNTNDRTHAICIEKKMSRTLGPIHEKGHWLSWWNSEIYSLYKDLNIVDDIKIRRLGGADHIMEEERIPKKIFNGKSQNTRAVGKPWIRWEEDIQKNALQIAGVWGWRRLPGDIEEWRCLLREANVQQGPYCHTWKDDELLHIAGSWSLVCELIAFSSSIH